MDKLLKTHILGKLAQEEIENPNSLLLYTWIHSFEKTCKMLSCKDEIILIISENRGGRNFSQFKNPVLP